MVPLKKQGSDILIRYSKVLNKNPREIVLLKSRPCKWGRCVFCDYIHDNCSDDESIIKFNRDILTNVTGEFNSLEVVNSASVFELPEESLKDIKDIVLEKEIKKLYFESHYSYKNRLYEIIDYFKGIDIVFKSGIETFDNDFRNNYLQKGVYFDNYQDVSKYFKSICLLVGIKGQTREMVRRDIEIVNKYFEHACINIYVENSTPVKQDKEIISWFKREYSYLEDYENFEILWNNTDFGIGGDNNESK